jgi:hypothetical protein
LNIRSPQSILHYSFTTLEYNIGFSIERIGSLKLSQGGIWEEINNDEALRYQMHDSHLKSISGNILLQKPGVYKVIWHNSFSYMKPKTLRYRLRVLEKQPASTEYSQHSLDDLFTVNDLNEREEQTYKALR